LPDSEDEKNAKIRLTCGSKDPYGAHYLLDYESEIYDQGNKFADVDAEVYFHMEGDNFVQTTTGKAIGDFGEFPLDEKVVCTKK
ncbi:MAG: hypothetical protein KDD40_05030, partial [Bdellovibrionales bacterium]|nr:hypothetical protein [Bdellovibrionales bacterium]